MAVSGSVAAELFRSESALVNSSKVLEDRSRLLVSDNGLEDASGLMLVACGSIERSKRSILVAL